MIVDERDSCGMVTEVRCCYGCTTCVDFAGCAYRYGIRLRTGDTKTISKGLLDLAWTWAPKP